MRSTMRLATESLAAARSNAPRAISSETPSIFEHNATRLNLGHPAINGTLTFTHPNLGRLCRYWHIREDANPGLYQTVSCDGSWHDAPPRFDERLHDQQWVAFKPNWPKFKSVPRLGIAVDTALVGLTELCTFRLQHCLCFLRLSHPA